MEPGLTEQSAVRPKLWKTGGEVSERPENEPKVTGKIVAIAEAGLFGRVIARTSDVFTLAILLAAVIIIFEVLMRYVLNSPTIWGHETVVFLTASSFLFGGLVVAARDSHIRVVLLYEAVTSQTRRLLNIVISGLCALSTLFFTLSMWVPVQRALFTPQGEFRIESSGSAFNSPYPGIQRVFLFAVLMMMSAQFIILTINYFRAKK